MSGEGVRRSTETRPETETPISKYLANLERRKSFYVSPSISGVGFGNKEYTTLASKTRTGGTTNAISMRLDFEDSFFHDASMLNISPPMSSMKSGKKRRRSFFNREEDEDIEFNELQTQKKNSELERLLRQTQAELINVRASQTKLEHLNNEMKKSHMEKIIQFEKVEAEMKIKCKNATEKSINLEKQLEKSEKKHTEILEGTEQQRTVYSIKASTMDEKMAVLQRENFELKQKLTQETMKSEEVLRKLQAELSQTEFGAEKWIIDSQILRDQLNLAQKQLLTCQTELKSTKIDVIKYQQIKNKYETAVGSNQASDHDRIILEEMVKKYENLYIKEQRINNNLSQLVKKVQDENSILRSTTKAEMILQERITSLETQVGYMSQELKEKGACDAERSVLQEEIKAWKSSSGKIEANCMTPLSLERAIRQLQNMLFEFKHENSDLKHNCENSTRVISTLQAESVSLREQLKNVKEEKEKLTGDMKKMSRRLVLIVKDRDGLRDLKDSYEKEFEGMISEPLKERISQLQTIVLEYEAILQEEAASRKPCPECEERNALVESLQSQLEATIREKELLSQTLANQSASTTLDNETDGVKIVAFANNPSMLTVEARLRECLSENEILKEKLKKIEEDTLVGLSDEVLLQEKRKLEDQLRVLERKHDILTQAYDYETVQLQQTCFKLFGFHVTLVREPQNQIRLQSTYSTCSDHIFIFQEAENDDMMLLETPILDHFRDDIERFLIGERSIPGFLASVTITYTQGLAQQLSNISEKEDHNITIISSQDSLQSQQQGSGQGQSEVQIQVEGQESSSTSNDEDEEYGIDTEDIVGYQERYESEIEADAEVDEDDGTVDERMSEAEDDDEDDDRSNDDDNDSDDSDIVMID